MIHELLLEKESLSNEEIIQLQQNSLSHLIDPYYVQSASNYTDAQKDSEGFPILIPHWSLVANTYQEAVSKVFQAISIWGESHLVAFVNPYLKPSEIVRDPIHESVWQSYLRNNSTGAMVLYAGLSWFEDGQGFLPGKSRNSFELGIFEIGVFLLSCMEFFNLSDYGLVCGADLISTSEDEPLGHIPFAEYRKFDNELNCIQVNVREPNVQRAVLRVRT